MSDIDGQIPLAGYTRIGEFVRMATLADAFEPMPSSEWRRRHPRPNYSWHQERKREPGGLGFHNFR